MRVGHLPGMDLQIGETRMGHTRRATLKLKPLRDRLGMRDNKRTWETLDAVIQHSTPPVQTGRERTYPYKLAARHISGLAPHIRRMGHGLGDLFAHARP
jgi:hypothetical protein